MVNCPNCGFEVATPIKTWPIPSRKPSKGSKQIILAAIFECPNCKAHFRSTVDAPKETQKTINIKDMVGRIRGIKEELMQTLNNLRDKIKTLETERANLMIEIEELRKVAESRATALEQEVSTLREEVKSLKDLLGYAIEEE